MKIVQFTANNVKRLVAVSITPDPDGNMIVLGGDNGNGKTSVLDSIAMVLGGADLIPAHPIHAGASKGQIVVETEEFVATRTFTPKGTQLVVKNKAGATLNSPQALLDGLTSRVSFDPLAFTRMDAKTQAETLRKLVGIDFAELKAKYEAAYEQRTGVNRDLKTQQARVDGMKKHPFTPKTPVDSAALLAKIKAASATNDANAVKRSKLDIAKQQVEREEKWVNEAEAAVAAAKRKLDESRASLGAANFRLAEIMLETKNHADIDTEDLREQLDQIEETNRKVRENATLEAETKKAAELAATSQRLTDQLEAIHADKQSVLAAAKFPVPGLSFTSDGVTYNGVSFAEASAAEQLRISVAMGFAMQPKLKVALIRDGSLLDDKNLALVAEIAAEHDGQVWIERVGKGEECTVILEDGKVADEQ